LTGFDGLSETAKYAISEKPLIAKGVLEELGDRGDISLSIEPPWICHFLIKLGALAMLFVTFWRK
jgi:hypothetical protein